MSSSAQTAARLSLRREAAERHDAGDCPTPGIIPLDLSYRLPSCAPLCEQDELRLSHADLAGMEAAELERESFRVRLTLFFGDLTRPSWAKPWLEARLACCGAETRKRKRAK